MRSRGRPATTCWARSARSSPSCGGQCSDHPGWGDLDVASSGQPRLDFRTERVRDSLAVPRENSPRSEPGMEGRSPHHQGRSAMRWLKVRFGLLIAASAAGIAAQSIAPPADLVVHEWGTFLSMSGSDGVALDGMYHEEHAL